MTISSRPQDLGEWIKDRFGDQGGLAAALKPKVAKNTVSSWKTGRNGIPADYQKQIRKLGFEGPWPQQEAKEAGESYVTRAEYQQLRDDLEDAFEVIRFLLSQLPEGSRPGVLPKRFR